MHNDVIRPRITAGVLAHSDHVHTCRPLLDIIIGIYSSTYNGDKQIIDPQS